MKTLQNNFTTPEQLERLLELGVPADSADCYIERYSSGYSNTKILSEGDSFSKMESFCAKCKREIIPCWSAGRLMEIIAECYQVDMPFRYFVRGGMMESLINTFTDLRDEIDFSKLED